MCKSIVVFLLPGLFYTGCQPPAPEPPQTVNLDFQITQPQSLDERLVELNLRTRQTCPANTQCVFAGSDTITLSTLQTIPGVQVTPAPSPPEVHLSHPLILEARQVDLGQDTRVFTHGHDLKISSGSVVVGEIHTQAKNDQKPGDVVVIAQHMQVQKVDTHAPDQQCAPPPTQLPYPQVPENEKLILNTPTGPISFGWIRFLGSCANPSDLSYAISQIHSKFVATLMEPLPPCRMLAEIDWETYNTQRPLYDGRVTEKAFAGGNIHIFTTTPKFPTSDSHGSKAAENCSGLPLLGSKKPQLVLPAQVVKQIRLSTGATPSILSSSPKLSLTQIRQLIPMGVHVQEEPPIEIWIPVVIENEIEIASYLQGTPYQSQQAGPDGEISHPPFTSDQWETQLPGFLKQNELVYP